MVFMVKIPVAHLWLMAMTDLTVHGKYQKVQPMQKQILEGALYMPLAGTESQSNSLLIYSHFTARSWVLQTIATVIMELY